MKNIFSYFKDRIITGLIVLVPATIIVIMLTDVLKKIMEVTAPLTKKFAFGGELTEAIIAVTIVVIFLAAVFFITGILFKTNLGVRFQKWIQNEVLVHIPLYKTLRGITLQLTGVSKANYPVVEVDLYGNSSKTIGIMTDTLADGRCVIYFPYAPIINIGQVNIVPKENVEKLEMSLKDAMDIITQIGFDSNKVYPKS
jgi:uncharacterized membrane protein